MKRSKLVFVATLSLCIVLIFALVGCGNSESKHKYGEWIVDKEATCEEEGLRHKICSVCNNRVDEKIPKTTHEFVLKTDDSHHWYECKNCGINKDFGLHEYDETGKCTICNKEFPINKFVFHDNGENYSITKYAGNDNVVYIPSSFKGKPVVGIEVRAFLNNNALHQVIMPDTITYIDNLAFSLCQGLSDITFSKNIEYVGVDAFGGTIWDSRLEAGVVYIGKTLYKYAGTMPSNTTIEVLDGTISISENAFINRAALSSITLPNSLVKIGYSAFKNCSGLTKIVIPDNVIEIGNEAFSGCEQLSQIKLSKKLEKIGKQAFANIPLSIIENVLIIILPKSIEYMDEDVFLNSYFMAFSEATSEPSTWNDKWNNRGEVILENRYSYYDYFYSDTYKASELMTIYWHYDTDGKTPGLWEWS